MAKHTKGPWVVRSYERVEGFKHYFVEATGVTIGHVFGKPYGQDILGDEEYPTKEADAHLVAAAPEMLAVLKEVSTTLCASRIEELRLLVREVIAKAERS